MVDCFSRGRCEPGIIKHIPKFQLSILESLQYNFECVYFLAASNTLYALCFVAVSGPCVIVNEK